MKPRIYCFGHGWAIDIPGEGNLNGMPVDVTHYMGRFDECIEHLDQVMPAMMMRSWREHCSIQRLGFQEIGSA